MCNTNWRKLHLYTAEVYNLYIMIQMGETENAGILTCENTNVFLTIKSFIKMLFGSYTVVSFKKTH